MPPTRPAAPPPLVVAASLAAIEGLGLAVFGLLELANLSLSRAALGLTTTLFFLLFGGGLLLSAWGLTRLRTWARGPVLLAQLVLLGSAWSFRGGETTVVAVVLAVVAVLALLGMLHPQSISALEGEETGGGDLGDPGGTGR